MNARPQSATGTPDPIETLLQEIRTEQARQADILADVLRLLSRDRGPRDEADAALLLAIAETMRDCSFTSAQVLARADADESLHDALEAADITTAQELGCVLRRLEGITVAGLRLERVGNSREGVEWWVRICEA